MEYLLSIIFICCFALIVRYAVTAGLTNGLYMLHKKAYKKYQEEVVTGTKLYDRYVTDFCNENIFLNDAGENISVEELNKRNMNYHIVATLLQERSDLVEKYFTRPEFSLKDFQELSSDFNTTIIPPKEERTIEIQPKPSEKGTESKTIVGKDNPFSCKLNKDEIALLTDCVNEANIFSTEITPQILEDFFYCRLSGALKSTNNRLLAYFMMRLSVKGYITYEWQSVIANNMLVLAPMKEKYLNNSDLSTANDNIKLISPKKSEIIDKYVKQLQKG